MNSDFEPLHYVVGSCDVVSDVTVRTSVLFWATQTVNDKFREIF